MWTLNHERVEEGGGGKGGGRRGRVVGGEGGGGLHQGTFTIIQPTTEIPERDQWSAFSY